MRRNNLIPSDTKILPLFLRQKGRKIKILKDRERQLPFPPREVLRKELIFPNSDKEWGRAWKSAVSTTKFQERLGHGHWQRERLTRDLIKEAGRVENRESQLQNGLIIQNVVHKKIQTVHPDSALCRGAGGKGWHWVLSSIPEDTEFKWRVQDSSWPVPSAHRYFCLVKPDADLNWSERRGHSFNQCILTRVDFFFFHNASGCQRAAQN